jgi:hypothetical protein
MVNVKLYSLSFAIFYDNWVRRLVYFLPGLVHCIKKNLATLQTLRVIDTSNKTRSHFGQRGKNRIFKKSARLSKIGKVIM